MIYQIYCTLLGDHFICDYLFFRIVFGNYKVKMPEFVSKSHDPDIWKEFLQFSDGRLSTWILDTVIKNTDGKYPAYP